MSDAPLFANGPWYACAVICFFIAFIILVVLFCGFVRRRFRRPKREPVPPLKPGEYEELLASLDRCPIQKKGLAARLLKVYWRRLLFILLMLCIPVVGWMILAIVAAVWLLNWGNEVQAYIEQQPDTQKFLAAMRGEPVPDDHLAARAVWWGTKKTAKAGWWLTRKAAKGTWWLTRKGAGGAYLDLRRRL
jgi:hypothetical protein